jgi:hypothetical protein
MSLDKFGRPQHYAIDTTLLEKEIVENVKKKIVDSFGKDLTFIEDGVKKKLVSIFDSVGKNVSDVRKRVNENVEHFQNLTKKFKAVEENFEIRNTEYKHIEVNVNYLKYKVADNETKLENLEGKIQFAIKILPITINKTILEVEEKLKGEINKLEGKIKNLCEN